METFSGVRVGGNKPLMLWGKAFVALMFRLINDLGSNLSLLQPQKLFSF